MQNLSNYMILRGVFGIHRHFRAEAQPQHRQNTAYD
jgi:hypothetical protein